MTLYNNHYKIELNIKNKIHKINIYSEDGFNLISSILLSEDTFNDFINNCINLLEFGIEYNYMTLPLYSTTELTRIEFAEVKDKIKLDYVYKIIIHSHLL